MENHKRSTFKTSHKVHNIFDPFDCISNTNFKLPPISPCVRTSRNTIRKSSARNALKPLLIPSSIPFCMHKYTFRINKILKKPRTPYFSFSQEDITNKL